jgi:tetratricopeptide (TPR) repeat protein
LTLVLSGCTTIQGAGDVAQGRQALFRGDDQAALGYFQRAEKSNPNYVRGTVLRAGILSYLGRAQYLTGSYAQARETLENAISRQPDDNVARLYLGLTMYRLGERPAALKNMADGMSGIADFLNDIERKYPLGIGKHWDPGGQIRLGIQSNLTMISGGEIDWAKLVANGESLGIKIEREQDLALQQERLERADDSGM